MSKFIKFKSNVIGDYRGRNGAGKCTGIEISHSRDRKLVRIYPTNSKGKQGITDACFIDIPKSDLAEILSNIICALTE